MKQKWYLIILALAVISVISIAAPRAFAGSESQPMVFLDEASTGSYLGVQTEDVTADRLGTLHLKEERGVEITNVDQDAPACKAGLKEHDVILSVNDQKIESVEQLKRVIREIPPGRTIAIGISRDGQPMSVKAQLAERDNMDRAFNFNMPPINIPAIHIPPINMPEIDVPSVVVMHSPARSGIMVENLTPQLGDFFGVKNGSGVLVRSVERGSRGEQAGFRAGDVIVKVNGSPVNDCTDFTRLLRKRTDNKASVTVLRDRKEQNLTLTLPETRHTGTLNESEACVSEDWDDCAADMKNEVAQLVPEMTTAELMQIGPEIQQQMQNFQPQMEKMRKDMQRMRPQVEKMKKEMCKEVRSQQKHLHKETESMQREFRRQQREFEKQLKDWMKATEI